MSFWNLNDSNETLDTTGKFESGGGDMTPIPAKTQVKAAIDDAKWDDYEGDEYISLRWSVLAPAEYKNRKIFQKVRVMDADSKKADKAKKMLAAISANAGGGLLKVGGKPTGQDLQKHLLQKPMALLLQVWKMDTADGEKTGNWISAVSPLKKNEPVEVAKSAPVEQQQAPASTESDDDIPW